MQNYVKPLYESTILVLLCSLIGFWNDQLDIGWLIGVITYTILGIWRQYSAEQWILVCNAQLLLLIIYQTPFPYGFLISILSIFLGMYLAFLGARDQLLSIGLNPREYIFDVLSGRIRRSQIVQTPSKAVNDRPDKQPGPALITVKPDTAVIMERGAQQTRILGPETFISVPAEYVKRVYNLKPRHRDYNFSNVLTKDLIPTKVQVSITYGVNIGAAARLGERRFTPEETDNLKKLDSWAEEWETELRSIVEKQLRQSVGDITISQATNVNEHKSLEHNVSQYTEEDSQLWGIKVYDLHIVSLQPDVAVTQAHEENWLTNTRSKTLKMQEEARGEAWKLAVVQLAQAYATARDYEMPPEAIYHELIRRMFEQFSVDPATRKLIPQEIRDFLSHPDENKDQQE